MKLKDDEFIRLRDFMYDKFGINLKEKRPLVESRLQTVLAQQGYNSFTEFLNHMERDTTGEDLSLVVTKMTTNFTYFYREEEHFNILGKEILPAVLPRIHDGNLNIWSAGCSSGEEPYTLAMFLDSYLGPHKRGLDARILATDISDRVMGIAREGIYDEDHMARMPKSWRKDYFTPNGDGRYRISPKIQKEIIFRKFNLMEPVFRFKKKFHVIFCRNVMIYFDDETRTKLAERFHDALMPGGYLVIGMSETLFHNEKQFDYLHSSTYRRRN